MCLNLKFVSIAKTDLLHKINAEIKKIKAEWKKLLRIIFITNINFVQIYKNNLCFNNLIFIKRLKI